MPASLCRRATSCKTTCVSSRRSPLFVQDALEHVEGAVRGRDAALYGRLQQHLADLLRRQPVPAGAADVQREFVETAERDQRGQRDAAARPAVETGTRPDLAPRIARDEVLEVGRLLRRAFDRALDVLVAEDFPADAHPAFPRVLGHAARCASKALLNSSARSTFARCAACAITATVALPISEANDSTCSGGDVGSSAPAIASVGASTGPSRPRRSNSRRISQ